MKGLILLSLIVVAAGCGQSEAEREFRRAVTALKVCSESSTSTQAEFHARRTDLETCVQLHARKLGQFDADYRFIRLLAESTDEVWRFFETTRDDYLDDRRRWASVFVISPQLREPVQNLLERRRAEPNKSIPDASALLPAREFRAITHVRRGREQTAAQCEKLLQRLR